MALSWSVRRKATYAGVILVLTLFVVTIIWLKFFNTAPTCFDGTQNGTEAGVDCGGSCSLQCKNTLSLPQVLWARAFPNGTNTYTAAAYVQNPNGEVGAHNVPYAFQLFDANNKLVIEKDGVVDIPPVQTVPIIEPQIKVGNRTVTRALFSFTAEPVWERVPHGSVPTIRIVDQTLSPGATRLDTTIANDLLVDIANVTVEAVLFDAQGVARAASKSVLPSLGAKSRSTVVFTWPQGVSNVTQAEIILLPSF